MAWFHYNTLTAAWKTHLVIDTGSWWIPMPDSDSPRLMHTVSLRYQTIIIKEDVKIVGGSRGFSREAVWRLFVT